MSIADGDFDDPFEAYFRRDPLPDAGIHVFVLDEGAGIGEAAEVVSASISTLFRGHPDRPLDVRVIATEGAPLCETLRIAIESATHPLVLITTARDSWTSAHLDPLLKAIDQCDHVVGRGPLVGLRKWTSRLAALPRRIIFGVTVGDAYSPCRLHRREKLAEIVIQSSSSFIDVEILAKANFLGHLIDEVDVPELGRWVRWAGWWPDLRLVFRDPAFRNPSPANSGSGPAEPAEGQDERHDRPGAED